MPTVKARRPGTRRRDREEEEDLETEDEVEEEEDEEEDLDEEEEEDEEEPPPPRARKSTTKKRAAKGTTKKRAAPRRVVEDEDDDEEDEDEDEAPPPRARKRTAKQSTGTRRASTGRSTQNGAVATSWEASDSMAKSAYGDVNWVRPDTTSHLFKFLQNHPITWNQHWPTRERPYTCLGKDKGCPLCKNGDNPRPTHAFNALQLTSEGGTPKVVALQLNQRPYRDLIELAKQRKSNKVNITVDYYAFSVSGPKKSRQTHVIRVKERDLEDDWEELFEDGQTLDDLLAAIEAAKEKVYPVEKIVRVPTKQELRTVVSELMGEDEEEDEDEE